MSIKIALAGNPNCGKTTLFNALTGSNQFVGNWPGVTVEKKEGKTMTLRDVSVGQTVKVTRLNGDGPVKRRIMDMGITKGVEVYVRKVAPLGDPVEVTVRGYELSLRKADAEMIEVG